MESRRRLPAGARETDSRRGRAIAWKSGLAAAAMLCAMPMETSAGDAATLFRVFLSDGSAVVSYGEFAHVGDRVVFSMPLGSSGGEPRLQLVNLPAGAIDWDATNRYAESARFVHYAASRAETDYTAMTAKVAATLNAIVQVRDPAQQLELALQGRRMLAEWPRTHYGYRASDVNDMLGFLDEAISGLRAAAGETSFGVDLVAGVEPPPAIPTLPEPTPAEAITQALTVARLADVPADRISLLHAALAAVEEQRGALSPAWVKSTRASALVALGRELQTERAYATLAKASLSAAAEAAGRADVRGVESVLARVRVRDERLGRKRPEEIAALIGGVQAQLDAGRRLRLARDRWHARIDTLNAYRRAIAPVIDRLSGAQSGLQDIKRLAGPRAATLDRMTARLAAGTKALMAVVPPEELSAAHALLSSALNLAAGAAQARREAVGSGDLQRAWDASSAAAGAIMLFARARADMNAALALPQLR